MMLWLILKGAAPSTCILRGCFQQAHHFTLPTPAFAIRLVTKSLPPADLPELGRVGCSCTTSQGSNSFPDVCAPGAVIAAQLVPPCKPAVTLPETLWVSESFAGTLGHSGW